MYSQISNKMLRSLTISKYWTAFSVFHFFSILKIFEKGVVFFRLNHSLALKDENVDR